MIRIYNRTQYGLVCNMFAHTQAGFRLIGTYRVRSRR